MARKCSIKVYYVLFTSGDKGWGKDVNMTSEKLGPIREKEQILAANTSGISEENVVFLRYGDGTLEGINPMDLKLNLTYYIRVIQPNLVIAFSPGYTYAQILRIHFTQYNICNSQIETDYSQYSYGLMHRDHQMSGKVTLDTLWPACRDYLAFKTELYDKNIMPWNVPELWMFSFNMKASPEDEILVKLSDWMFEGKYLSLLQHQSQYDDPNAVRTDLQNLGKSVGYGHGYTDGAYEAFQIVRFNWVQDGEPKIYTSSSSQDNVADKYLRLVVLVELIILGVGVFVYTLYIHRTSLQSSISYIYLCVQLQVSHIRRQEQTLLKT